MNAKLEELKSWYETTFQAAPSVMAWAPGRVEFLGNHTDYNLGMVLGSTIDRGIIVMMTPRKDQMIGLASTGKDHPIVEVELDGLEPLPGDSPVSWVNYPLGVLKIMIQNGMRPQKGFNIGIWSDLPEGSGLSSSAALETASALALGKLYGFVFEDKYALMRTGWRAEREFVGMPCGILDQTVVIFGDADHLVSIDCKAELAKGVRFQGDYQFWVFNTAHKHALIDSFYADRNAECMGARDVLRTVEPGIAGLCDLSPAAFEPHKGLLEPVALKRATHIIEENARVRETIRLLEKGAVQQEAIGSLLFQSHRSSQHLFENSTEDLDFLVDTLERAEGVYGARLTGGGFGGAVLAMTTPEFGEAGAAKIRSAYAAFSGRQIEPLMVKAGPGAKLL